MAEVVVVGSAGALTESLSAGLGEVSGGCSTLAPSEDGLAGLAAGEEGAERRTLVYAALAGIGLDGRPDLPAAERVFAQALAAGIEHLVLVASAAVHEPSAHHAGHVSEDRLASRRRGNTVAQGWLDLERLARKTLQESSVGLTILRSAAVPTADGNDFFSRLLRARMAFPPAGFDPSLQLLSTEDLARAVAAVVAHGVPADGRHNEVYHVTPRGVMPLRQALRAARPWRLPVPYGLQQLGRKLAPTQRAAPADQLDYLRYPWTVSGDKIERDLGFVPRRSSAEAVSELAPRRSERPAAPAEYDDFGMDKDYVARLGRSLLRFMHDVYWRVEWNGLEHVPLRGRGVLAGVHRGHQPWDGVMTFHLLVRELGRYPRYLIHPTLVKFPFLAPYMVKCGGVHACQENAEKILEREGLLAIFPEGIRGAFTMYKDAYKLGKFGRDEYVKIALRHRAPIIPYVTVGSAEIFPILGRIDWPWWKRYSEWPFFPITPTMGSIPLPSKWHTWFLEPIPVDDYPPEAAADRATVRAISQQVRQRMEDAIAEMLRRRKSIWWGSIFDDEEKAAMKEKVA
ncbi:MAG: 1-acyl-sn-glycerol-3-phosphate acyltransferase [Acidobacteriota bacterium]